MSEKSPDLPVEELEELKAQEQKSSSTRLLGRMLRRKTWLIAGLTSLTTFAGLFWSSLDRDTYTGNFFLLVEPITSAGKLTNPTTIARTEGQPRDDLFSLDYPTNLAFLQSPGMTRQIAQDILDKKETEKKLPEMWKDLRDNFAVSRVSLDQNAGRGETKIFAVSYQGEDPQEVQAVLEVAADTFVKYSAEDRETSIKAGVKFIDQQIPAMQGHLQSLKDQQQKLRQQHELLDPAAQGQELMAQVTALSQKQLELESTLKAQKTLYNLLKQQLQLTPQEALAAAGLSQDPTRVALLTQLQQVEGQIATAAATFTANSPQLRDLQEQRQNVFKLLERKTQQILQQNSLYLAQAPQASPVLNFQDETRLNLIGQLIETSNQIQMLEVQNRAILTAQKALEQKSRQFPAIINRYSDLERKIALTQEIVDKLLVQRETLKVEAAQELPWKLISQPQIPLDEEGKPMGEPPSRGKKIAAGVLSGLLLGIGLAFLLEKRRDMFYEADDIQDTFGLPVIGEIPPQGQVAALPKLASAADYSEEEAGEATKTEVPVLARLASPALAPFLESFDALYAELSLLYSEPPLRSVIVNSIEPGDGQATVALHLAIAAATAGQKVLLVDANWHEPKLHQRLNLNNYKGLSQLLADRVPPEELVQSVPHLSNLNFLSAGSLPNDLSIRLGSHQMKSLMADLEEKYELVIYNPPHFFETPDLGLMVSQSDGLLLVVALKKTSQSLSKKAIEKIKTLRLPVLGMVANYYPSQTRSIS